MFPLPDPEKHLQNIGENTSRESNCSGIGMRLAQAPLVTASSFGGNATPEAPPAPWFAWSELKSVPLSPGWPGSQSLDLWPPFPPGPPLPPNPPGPPLPPVLLVTKVTFPGSLKTPDKDTFCGRLITMIWPESPPLPPVPPTPPCPPGPPSPPVPAAVSQPLLGQLASEPPL